MKTKTKMCRSCRKYFKPFRTTQTVCSWDCALKDVEKKKIRAEQMKEQLEQRRQSLRLRKNMRWSIEATVQVVHNFVKLRDKGRPCVSCLRDWNSSFQAGHYHKAELFSSLKFHLDNIHSQCPLCNNYKEGNLNDYALNLPNRIGKEQFIALNRLAYESKQEDFKWNKDVMKDIRKHVRLLTKQHKELWKN